MHHPSQSSLATGTLQERASRRHPEQIYYLYVPTHFEPGAGFRLLVTMHGRDREAAGRAEHFVTFAERHNSVILGPRFDESMRYQTLGVGGERADVRLLDLIDEVASELSLDADQFDLFGFSGGAQFAHRFLYVWPRRLRSVIVGAPGTVTLPSKRERWPVGVRDLAQVTGARFNLDDVRRARLLLIVGTSDTLTEALNQSPWAMQSGETRLSRTRRLHAAWRVAGIEHEYVEVPNTGHIVNAQIVEQTIQFLLAGR
jgi:poly(3-hydroxybutyrate) depolymerase